MTEIEWEWSEQTEKLFRAWQSDEPLSAEEIKDYRHWRLLKAIEQSGWNINRYDAQNILDMVLKDHSITGLTD